MGLPLQSVGARQVEANKNLVLKPKPTPSPTVASSPSCRSALHQVTNEA